MTGEGVRPGADERRIVARSLAGVLVIPVFSNLNVIFSALAAGRQSVLSLHAVEI